MDRVPSSSPAEPAGPSPSRRSLLRGGTFLSLSAVTAVACAPQAAVPPPGGQVGTYTGEQALAGRLILDYQPSKSTGWASDIGDSPTIGGHISSRNFTFQGKKYRVSLLSFGQPGDSPDPVYEDVPADATIKFRQTLASAWGAHYSFRYAGGLPRVAKFIVESYSAWAGKVIGPISAEAWGGDLYVVYHPGHRVGHPRINSDLQFIQVVNYGTSFVDNDGRANPFYGDGGGLTSINGNQSVSFYDHPRLATKAKGTVSALFMAEVFLAQDTGIKNAAGKGIVNIFGGVKWGWQVQSAP
jgi:hypothetical protein